MKNGTWSAVSGPGQSGKSTRIIAIRGAPLAGVGVQGEAARLDLDHQQAALGSQDEEIPLACDIPGVAVVESPSDHPVVREVGEHLGDLDLGLMASLWGTIADPKGHGGRMWEGMGEERGEVER